MAELFETYDDLEDADIKPATRGDLANTRCRPNQNWNDELQFRRLDGTFQRNLIAGMCDGHGHRRVTLGHRDQTLEFLMPALIRRGRWHLAA